LTVLKDEKTADASRVAALELLGQLKSHDGVGVVIDMLSKMPRGLWPAAGQMLRDVTGQDFGPREGDGFAQVGVAVKQWREWREKNEGQ
jgi:hypothetical protein